MIENNFYIKHGYKQINYVKEEFRDYATGTTPFPYDVPPVNTYGDEFIQKSYKPVSNDSLIYVKATTYFDFGLRTCGLFVDDVVNAIGACPFYFNTDYVSGEYVNSSLAEKVFKFRAGVPVSGTVYFNRWLNQNVISSLQIHEFIKL